MQRIRWSMIVILIVASLAHGGGSDKDKAKGKLEGSWVIEKEGKKATMTFTKDTFTFLLSEKRVYKGTYKTDTSKKPNQMDMTIKEGPPNAEGKTALCIYEVDGDTLKWCANDPGEGNERLKDFPEKEGNVVGHVFLVFKRAK